MEKSIGSFIVNGIVAVIILLFVYSCVTTDITNKNIEDMNISLHKDNEQSVESLIPGEKYRLKVKITDRNGRTINNPSPAGLSITSNDDTFMNIETTSFGVNMTGTTDTLAFTQLPGFSITVKVKDNQYYTSTTWPVDWKGFNTLGYSGTPGRKGRDGQDGPDGLPSFGIADGRDGLNGWSGEDGEKGNDVTVLVVYYSVKGLDIKGISDERMIFVADTIGKKEYLLKNNNVIIDASGGDGGAGGNGGDSGLGAEYSYTDDDGSIVRKRGTNGTPGTGGTGGNGGDGGDIRLLYVQDSVPDNIHIINRGGNGGKAGINGKEGSFGIRPEGMAFDGNPGKDGRIEMKKITPEQVLAICSFIDNRYFEIGRIILD